MVRGNHKVPQSVVGRICWPRQGELCPGNDTDKTLKYQQQVFHSAHSVHASGLPQEWEFGIPIFHGDAVRVGMDASLSDAAWK